MGLSASDDSFILVIPTSAYPTTGNSTAVHSMNQAISFTIILAHFHVTLSDFLYVDFNKTTGLVFNGAALPTACAEPSNVPESKNNSNNNATTDGDESILYQYGHTATTDVFSTVETNKHNSSTDDIAVRYAVFGHRLEYEVDANNTGCGSRMRLTPSHPSKAGSVWYDSRVPVVSFLVGPFSQTRES